jgi:DNA helicase-2/ATP-dependent DNA helicase PcrA
MSINSDDRSDIEEERRLCYVGITRARERLVMSGARLRMVNGETHYSKTSRFVDEIPEEMIERDKLEPRVGRRYEPDEFADEELPWNQSQKSLGVSKFGMKSNSYASSTASYVERDIFGLPKRTAGDKRSGGSAAFSTASSNPGFGKAFSVQKQSALEYGEGDRVRHIKFGEGTVQKIVDGAKDYEVTVDFDRAGVKKMFASFAKLQKV